MDLKNAVCIVTGAGTGTGAACAVQLARKGCRVVVNYSRSEEGAQKTVEMCVSAGAEAMAVRGNVSEDEDCRSIARSGFLSA